MKTKLLVICAAAMVVMLSLFGSAGSVAALGRAGAAEPTASEEKVASPDHRRVRLVGVVVQVHEDGLLLRTQRGPVRVRVTDATVIRVLEDEECVEGTLDDIEVGEPAMVVGILTDRHVVVARGVSQCPPSTEGSEN